MKNLLFDTPWWLPTMLFGVGVVLFWTANRRGETKLRNVGLLLVSLTVALIAISHFFDTDLEKCVKASKQLVRDVEQQNWPRFTAALSPNVTVSVLRAGQMYVDRNETVKAAQDGVNWWGVKNIRVLSTKAEQTDTIITVQLALLSDHDKAGIPTINTGWEMEWQQSGNTWSLIRITCLKIGNLTDENAARQFPRPR